MQAQERRASVLRTRLEELEEKLAAVEARLVALYSDAPNSAAGDSIVMEAPEGGCNRVGMIEIAQIRAALARIAQGTYGLCSCCGRAIAEERLDTTPATPFCDMCSV